MQGEVITQGSLPGIDWHSDFFKWCDFKGFSVEGEEVDSVFLSCSFSNVDWYWGLFHVCTFIICRFTDCVFRGSSFPDCKFVECIFTNCHFVQDNLGGNCKFDRAIAYSCTFDGVDGFAANLNG